MTVRTYYMPNEDWRTICQQGRALREAERTLTGHAAGQDTRPVLDHAAVAKAIGGGTSAAVEPSTAEELPEPLASVVDYLSDELNGREFVPTAELVEALGVEPTAFGRQMGDLGCKPTRERITTTDGVRQVRGYLVVSIRAAAETSGKTADYGH
jgi:S-DNA-T family DNA segregation ATPase FtsK/SpoIIIE